MNCDQNMSINEPPVPTPQPPGVHDTHRQRIGTGSLFRTMAVPVVTDMTRVIEQASKELNGLVVYEAYMAGRRRGVRDVLARKGGQE